MDILTSRTIAEEIDEQPSTTKEKECKLVVGNNTTTICDTKLP